MPEDRDDADDREDQDADDTEREDDGGAGDEDDGDSGDEGKRGSSAAEAKARREAASLRKRLREAERSKDQATKDAVAKVLQALGVKDADDVDPAKLKEQTERQAEKLRQTSTELAIYRAAGRYGADPDMLLDSRSFLAGVADLDPTDPDFNAQVADAIKDAVKKNPRYKGKAQVAGSTGGEHRSGTGSDNDGGEETPESAYKAVLKRRSTRR